MNKVWWKEAVIYQVYPRSFKDSNADGIGDLRGIIEKLDYLQSLGIKILWLGPVYQSPMDDNGYDIADYYAVHSDFGTMDDLLELLQGLHDRGIKLLMDLVVNHTSDEHDWFQESRKSKDNPYRDYYIWRKGNEGQPPNNWPSFFGGSAWEYDKNTEEYYLHLFSRKQPDLNWENPKVREEVNKVVEFWLEKGVDGFRMDVIPLISKRLEFEDVPRDMGFWEVVEKYYSNGPRVHEFLRELNDKVLVNYDCTTVGEGPGITIEHANDYVGKERKELNMIFPLEMMTNNMGKKGRFDVRRENWVEIKHLIDKWDKAIGQEGWINIFLDNHDFIRMVSRYGDDKEYREESTKLLLTMILTLRGTPCIYQGSEIGMTNIEIHSLEDYRDVETQNFVREAQENGLDKQEIIDLANLNGRDNVRTVMQWDGSKNAGFTTAEEPWIAVNPNYREVNVQTSEEDEQSVLHYLRDIIHFRNQNPVLVYGSYEDLLPAHPTLFVYKREAEGARLLVVLNCSSERANYRIPPDYRERELLFSNYQENIFAENVMLQLRPWEACIFRTTPGEY